MADVTINLFYYGSAECACEAVADVVERGDFPCVSLVNEPAWAVLALVRIYNNTVTKKFSVVDFSWETMDAVRAAIVSARRNPGELGYTIQSESLAVTPRQKRAKPAMSWDKGRWRYSD